uniref:Uncharacterized protein n=1 Tax=Rhizophora mucronata TaxID=61149 RepID=A0A2P2QI70_RHIMU
MVLHVVAFVAILFLPYDQMEAILEI